MEAQLISDQGSVAQPLIYASELILWVNHIVDNFPRRPIMAACGAITGKKHDMCGVKSPTSRA
jgi:hypothetical protein